MTYAKGLELQDSHAIKHGAILYNEAEVFSLSVTNPNGLPMLPFDWLIHSSLITGRPSSQYEELDIVVFFFNF